MLDKTERAITIEWTIQKYWQTLDTQETRRRRTKHKNTTQKTTTMSNTNPTNTSGEHKCWRRESSTCFL